MANSRGKVERKKEKSRRYVDAAAADHVRCNSTGRAADDVVACGLAVAEKGCSILRLGPPSVRPLAARRLVVRFPPRLLPSAF